ncbi:NAD(P)/FAD-dependent oxidoreductase [Nocardioides sp.]|uniref:NAD(P)/FAD-dependent oxidoreductase n=1 Tax=Nocardioides sp. TaxID=35761 RepID=UPI002ED6A424
MISARYDVVVVGARPAGAMTAMVLARAGLRVLMVDRCRYGDDTISTHALLRAAVLQLKRWGLLDRVVAAGTPPVLASVFHYGEEQVEVPIKPQAGVDALYAPRRTVLDPILVDAAREAGVETRFGITVTGLHRDDDGRVTGVIGRDASGAPFTAGARITVGADGMGSRVAHLAGAPVERAGTNAASFIYGYWSGLPVDRYELFYRPGVAAGLFPTNDGQACVFAAVPRRDLRSESRGGGVARAYTRLLSRAAPDAFRSATPAPGRLKVFSSRPGFFRRSYGHGWALVGDAGYFKDPITSHGLSDALRDGELLARAIIEAASGNATEEVALASYQRTRDCLSARLLATTDAIASFSWDLDRIPTLLLELSDSMGEEVRLLRDLDPVCLPPAALSG